MRRPGKAGGKAVKTQRRKTLRRRNALKTTRRRTPRAAGAETNVARLIRERDEAREQQTATAEILQVIRTSPADAQPVFETIVRNAVSLCGSLYANVFRFDGELLHFVASHNVGPNFRDMLQKEIPDAAGFFPGSWESYAYKNSGSHRGFTCRSELRPAVSSIPGGFRRLLGVPMLHGSDLLGAIVVGWAEPGPIPKIQKNC